MRERLMESVPVCRLVLGIGKQAIIGVGSAVTKDLPSGQLWRVFRRK